jgi:hypothetical protein
MVRRFIRGDTRTFQIPLNVNGIYMRIFFKCEKKIWNLTIKSINKKKEINITTKSVETVNENNVCWCREIRGIEKRSSDIVRAHNHAFDLSLHL